MGFLFPRYVDVSGKETSLTGGAASVVTFRLSPSILPLSFPDFCFPFSFCFSPPPPPRPPLFFARVTSFFFFAFFCLFFHSPPPPFRTCSYSLIRGWAEPFVSTVYAFAVFPLFLGFRFRRFPSPSADYIYYINIYVFTPGGIIPPPPSPSIIISLFRSPDSAINIFSN